MVSGFNLLGSDGYPVKSVSEFTANGGVNRVLLTWKDPNDVVIDGEVVAKWAGTKIIRREDRFPRNEKDGDVVIDNKVRNKYESTPFIDHGLNNNTEYFYMAFPYTEKNIYTLTEESRAATIPRADVLYNEGVEGVNWVVGYSLNSGSQQKMDDRLRVSVRYNNGNGTRTWVTEEPVDLSNIDHIEIDWAGSQSSGLGQYTYFYATKEQQGNHMTADAKITHNDRFTRRTQTLSVSGLSGDYYQAFAGATAHSSFTTTRHRDLFKVILKER